MIDTPGRNEIWIVFIMSSVFISEGKNSHSSELILASQYIAYRY